MLNEFRYSLPEELQTQLDTASEWYGDDKVARIWQKDASVWTDDDEAKWLGWLNIVDEEMQNAQGYIDLQADIAAAGFESVLLMGMGGSSLCPEVLAMTFGKSRFHILDSTVPAQIKTVESNIHLEKTLFIVASKSGSTLEPNCFKQYFFERVAEKVGRENAGRQFVAITDPGSKMEQVAKEDGFRHVFYGKPEIGGRFSALSAFGMTAAASMGLIVESFLQNTHEMVDACRNDDPTANPGALLGLILGLCERMGRDKLTILTSDEIHDIGAWLEQLIAESTGKNGVAIIPVDREPPVETYGEDRVFALLSLSGNEDMDARYSALTAAGHPAIRIDLPDVGNLGQEFFRWEFATAVAGSVMQINPFNQPDVEAAKIEARKLTDEYEQSGKLPDEKPFHTSEGIALYTSDAYAAKLDGGVPAAIIRSHLDQIGEGDYFGLLAYIEMNAEHEHVLQQIRGSVLARYGCATCLGFGPRFLHSTGQAYKGGGNNGVFLQITSDDASDLEVPGQKYTFGVVKAAQARGDFQVLVDRGRRALRVHLGADVNAGLQRLAEIITAP
ncbi:MAG TPA: bifunctional transaldolase/phosoglucose isomerase [Pyrinomonadaceae bacterium]|jgi:transaldolase/glucose-6-phosphate isomerase|nr:bifunctional transaldolase/phosoglucose isomerase [Pyrinomonadaceae bacterium]